jgi:AcrR family transcriptional regulator
MSRVDIRSIRRRQILDAAEQLAALKGWTETTIADICQAADVSTGVVTRHFLNKDEIMLAALDDILEQLRAQLQSFLGSEQSLSEFISRFFQVLSQLATSQPTLPQILLHFMVLSTSRPEIAERLHAFFSHHRQQNITDLEGALDEQGIRGKERVLLVNLTFTLAFSLILSPDFLGIDFSPEQLAAHYSTMLHKYFDLPQVDKVRAEE